MFLRQKYVDVINELVDIDFVKVFIGMRRSGKTGLMISTIDLLKNRGVKEENILYISLESAKYNDIYDNNQLDKIIYSYAKEHKGRLYILIDDIQQVRNWEKSVNAYRVDLDCDIYVTGSNSKLLSTELSTLLAGR